MGGAGFAASGSGLDILRSGAQQGAIMLATTSQQGLITEAGYTEQQQSYNIMATAAGEAAAAEKTAATGAYIGAAISAVAGIVSPFLPNPGAAPASTTSNNPTQIGALY